jgi:hypothetical protein
VCVWGGGYCVSVHMLFYILHENGEKGICMMGNGICVICVCVFVFVRGRICCWFEPSGPSVALGSFHYL